MPDAGMRCSCNYRVKKANVRSTGLFNSSSVSLGLKLCSSTYLFLHQHITAAKEDQVLANTKELERLHFLTASLLTLQNGKETMPKVKE